ncbi:MAG: hypothetical protein J2P45_05860 [Candidatus Dormibacteraeota bacterium]|nr:hypothetical protein [Candidatus Dormibacteraeota bacterium]
MEFTYRGYEPGTDGRTGEVTWRNGAYIDGDGWLLQELAERAQQGGSIALTPTGRSIEANVRDPQAAVAMVSEVLIAESFTADFDLPEPPELPEGAIP